MAVSTLSLLCQLLLLVARYIRCRLSVRRKSPPALLSRTHPLFSSSSVFWIHVATCVIKIGSALLVKLHIKSGPS